LSKGLVGCDDGAAVTLAGGSAVALAAGSVVALAGGSVVATAGAGDEAEVEGTEGVAALLAVPATLSGPNLERRAHVPSPASSGTATTPARISAIRGGLGREVAAGGASTVLTSGGLSGGCTAAAGGGEISGTDDGPVAGGTTTCACLVETDGGYADGAIANGDASDDGLVWGSSLIAIRHPSKNGIAAGGCGQDDRGHA
jgi:hypothetical protein